MGHIWSIRNPRLSYVFKIARIQESFHFLSNRIYLVLLKLYSNIVFESRKYIEQVRVERIIHSKSLLFIQKSFNRTSEFHKSQL